VQVKPGDQMNLYWAQSNKFMLVITGSAATLVGVLTILVIEQQHDQRTTVTVPAASVRTNADTMASPNVVPPLDPATTPDPANGLVGLASHPPQLAAASQVATVPLTPALVAPAPQSITQPQPAPTARKLLNTRMLPHRRAVPVPASPPAPPAPQINPVRPATAVKPGAPPEIS
jgi:hypothetical protein